MQPAPPRHARPVQLPQVRFTRKQLKKRRYGLKSVAKHLTTVDPLASELAALEEFCTQAERLDRMRGLEHSGNEQ